jgi:hypothetical protein
MRMFVVAIIALFAAGPAVAQDYDIEGYCSDVAAAVGGSYAIEATCRQQEEHARQAAARQIEPRIRSYRADVGGAVGGSYQIFMSCVDQE